MQCLCLCNVLLIHGWTEGEVGRCDILTGAASQARILDQEARGELALPIALHQMTCGRIKQVPDSNHCLQGTEDQGQHAQVRHHLPLLLHRAGQAEEQGPHLALPGQQVLHRLKVQFSRPPKALIPLNPGC